MLYAHVALHVPVPGTFSYHIPESLQGTLQTGHVVRVAFGTAAQPAIVVDINDRSDVPETKPILEILDPKPVVDKAQIELAFWMAERFVAPIGFALWLWLPPAFTGRSVRVARLADEAAEGATDLEQRVLASLRARPEQRLTALEREHGSEARRAINALEKRGAIAVYSILSEPRVRPRTVRTARLIISGETLARWRFSPRQRVIVDYLAQFSSPQDVPEVYSNTGATSADLNKLEAKGVLQLGERIVYRDRLADQDFVPAYAPPLTPEQERAWQQIARAMDDVGSSAPIAQAQGGRVFLLHGVTGSGKTEIYLRAIQKALQMKQQAIFLVPEIALTPQTIHRVAARFPDQVAVVHSSLSTGERYDTWQRCRDGRVDIVVGTRSALFMPLARPGLIVIDEEHDSSYKQTPPVNPPYYHARTVAEHLARARGATLVLGSATPDVETYYRAQTGQIAYLSLPRRIMGHRERITGQARRQGLQPRYSIGEAESMTIELPPVNVVDMREELKAGNTSMFSRALQQALAQTLERGEQAILFLNRRGQATYVFCRDCGYVEICPRCSTPMTYHRHGEALRCHHCGFIQQPLTTCPVCASRRIKYFGAGTQQVEAELARLFPGTASVRWDADTASGVADHEAILAQFAGQQAQVMIGTQMIAKGLDLPLVTLVGVVSADLGLTLPDFRAAERSFQLLTQVAGRAGRGVLGGQVVLQTYQPGHESIVAAAQHDYQRFYESELPARRALGYPPFRRVARLLAQSTQPAEAQRTAERLAARLEALIRAEELDDTTLIGPAPCFFTRLDNHYRWHVLVRSADPGALVRQLGHTPGVYIDVDPIDVL
jgi:primosomal protein N' (replication factor Y)